MAASTRDAIASPPDPTPFQLTQIAQGNESSCRDLVDSWERPITLIASGYAARPADREDLVQVGRIAVYSAALKYRAAEGAPFSHYAKRAIKNRVRQAANRLSRQRRFQVPIEGVAGAEATDFVTTDAIRRVREWVSELPEPHATLFRVLYVEGRQQWAAAAELGRSQPWVSLTHRSFLDLARAALAD